MVKHTDPLPAAVRARRWRLWSLDGNSAVRLDGPAQAPFSAAVRLNPDGWGGYLETARRSLRQPAATLLQAIEQLELAESQGLYSSLWRDGGNPPKRIGWTHRVCAGRDEWHAVSDSPHLTLSVFLLAPVRVAAGPAERFAAFVDDTPITQVFGAGAGPCSDWHELVVFDNPQKAMKAAEDEAAAQRARMGVNRPLRLVRTPESVEFHYSVISDPIWLFSPPERV